MKPSDKANLELGIAIVKRNREASIERGEVQPIEIPLKTKYLFPGTAKFGGRKRKNSNSGGVGRAGRRAKRPRVPSNIR